MTMGLPGRGLAEIAERMNAPRQPVGGSIVTAQAPGSPSQSAPSGVAVAAPVALGPRVGQRNNPTTQNTAQESYEATQAQMNELMQIMRIDEASLAKLYPDIYASFKNRMQSQKSQYEGTPYGYSQGANWQRPGNDPNAPWASGQDAPMAGVDQRVAYDIYNPNAYQYGGRQGMAQEEAARFGGLAEAARQQQGAAYGQYNEGLGMSDAARGQQLQGLQMLQGLASGTGPSAAQAQMAQGLTAARQQQASIAASARGGGSNLAAAQAASANAASGLSMQGIQSASQLRAQEQIGAMSQYGQAANQLRASDFGRAQLAQQQQQLSYGQASEQERYRQQVFSQQQGYQQAQEQQQLAREAAAKGWNLQQKAADTAERNTWIQAGTSAAAIAAMVAMSDERAKTDVRDGGGDIDDMVSKLKPLTYRYKDGLGQEEGDHTGIMAQHLAASRAGAKAVMTGDDGILRVKAPQAATLALSGLARIAERLDRLEKKNAGK